MNLVPNRNRNPEDIESSLRRRQSLAGFALKPVLAKKFLLIGNPEQRVNGCGEAAAGGTKGFLGRQ
jgi:hypothetical protein